MKKETLVVKEALVESLIYSNDNDVWLTKAAQRLIRKLKHLGYVLVETR